jgi:hypothetical protein
MAVSSLAFSAAQVPSFICSLSRQKGCCRANVVFRAQPIPLPFSFTSRNRWSRLAVPSLRLLQASSPKYGTMLRAATESEHLGTLNGQALTPDVYFHRWQPGFLESLRSQKGQLGLQVATGGSMVMVFEELAGRRPDVVVVPSADLGSCADKKTPILTAVAMIGKRISD